MLASLAVGCGREEPSALLPPAHGIYFGAKAGPSESDVATLERTLRRKLAIRATFVSWEEQWPDVRVVADHRAGRLSLVTWAGPDLGSIASSRYDQLIRGRAEAIRELGFPIFVRPMHEMNGTWFPWCCDPDLYRAAWRRIHDIFSDEGATNVAWVWSPTASVGGWDRYYPGDDYVDWIGASVYNWGNTAAPRKWRSLSEILGPFYADLADRGKPIMLAEVGSAEQGGDKAAWVLDGATALEQSFPSVKAWIHQEYTDGTADWRVDSSPESLVAYRRIVRGEYFGALRPG
jgi:endoglucanase